MSTPISGSRVNLYIGGTALGCLQNASFNGTMDTKDVACAASNGYKDYAAGLVGWSLSGQWIDTEEVSQAATILALWKARGVITAMWELTGTGGITISGDAFITAVGGSANKVSGDPATFDITVTGKGEPTIG